MKKFIVKVGKAFELSFEIKEDKSSKRNPFVFPGLLVMVLTTSAAYGAMSGDYYIFDNIIQIFNRLLELIYKLSKQ